MTRVSRYFFVIGLPLALGLVALIYGGMELWGYLRSSSRFAVKEVEVVTKGNIDRGVILRRAAIPPGTNIFSINLEEVRARVEKEPWVHSATVVRALPDRIQIHYTAQEPKAILGAGSMYYLNSQGVPFYQLQSGDSLKYPLVQVDGKWKDRELLRQRVEAALRILEQFRHSPVFTEKDLGDLTVRMGVEDGGAPFVLSLRFPPSLLTKKGGKNDRLYSVSLKEDEVESQVKRWEAVVRHLVQQGKNPKFIRLELGKKVVVKLDR